MIMHANPSMQGSQSLSHARWKSSYRTFELARVQDEILERNIRNFSALSEAYANAVVNGREYAGLQEKILSIQVQTEGIFKARRALLGEQSHDTAAYRESRFNDAQFSLLGFELVWESKNTDFVKTIDMRYNRDPAFRACIDRQNEMIPVPEKDPNDPTIA